MDFIIKNDEALIKIDILGRAYPESTDYFDINWLIGNIYMKIPGYIVDFSTCIQTSELRAFYDGMKLMHDSLSGIAKLSTMESGVFIDAKIDKRGNIEFEVETQYPEGTGATLNFKFTSNQSYLYETLVGLRKIISEYQVLLA